MLHHGRDDGEMVLIFNFNFKLLNWCIDGEKKGPKLSIPLCTNFNSLSVISLVCVGT